MRITTIKNRVGLTLAGAALALLVLCAGASSAQAAPKWFLTSASNTTMAAGGQHHYLVTILNHGDTDLDGITPFEFRVDLPAGVTADSLVPVTGFATLLDCPSLAPGVSSFTCTIPFFPPKDALINSDLIVDVAPGATGTLTAEFEVSGGGGATVTTADPTLVADDPPGFGIEAFDSQVIANAAGDPYALAGGHPYAITTQIRLNSDTHPVHGEAFPIEPPKDFVVDLPAGLIGNPTAVGECAMEQLAKEPLNECPKSSQVGVVRVVFDGFEQPSIRPLYNMAPPVGAPARFAFSVAGTVISLDASLRSDDDYGLTVASVNTPEPFGVVGSNVTFWNEPSDPSHDDDRFCPELGPVGGFGCAASEPLPEPFFRMPTSCNPAGEGMPWELRANSWVNPGFVDSRSIESHLNPSFPYAPQDWGAPQGTTACDEVPIKGKLTAQPTSIDTETSTGLNVHVEVPNPGMDNPDGIASSDIKGVKVSLPQGVTINPSQAEGLGTCSEGRYESTELSFFPTPGRGCPDDSKIGTVAVKTPLLEETIEGDVYIAEPNNNPFNSLLALYIVLRNLERGILIKLAGKVETDEQTGRIVTTFDDVPQQPFDSFDFKFREGARAPLVTPPTCGKYTTEAVFTPWSDPSRKLTSTSSFEITRGIGGGPCPSGGTPGFNPGFLAGTINNNAGSFSPTNMRLTRSDGEQNLTRFSAVLPPGLLAKLAGVEKCSDAAIASAGGKTGRSELASPSCPANSQIGRTLAGAGVGSVLTYVPGKIYLAGPYKGAPLSIAAITPAVAGPFDVGTVVVREALDLDPVTGVASVDGAASDPIPHILKGIPLKLRDLRVYVDRPEFTLNPTSCDPSAVGATLWGSAADVFNPADDVAVGREARFQAANCLNLGFRPRLKINLKGSVKRGGHPALRAVLLPRPGDANIARTVVRLPRSAFLDQGHIRTICTRVQWAADACPRGAIYGKVEAWTPLLDEPLSGLAYLRSSDNKLPDLVFDLQGLVDIETAARIDSIKGGIRATFPAIPDAPLSRVVVEMRGDKKGLIVNSRNICKAKNRATVKMDGHNGRVRDFRPLVQARCGKGSQAGR